MTARIKHRHRHDTFVNVVLALLRAADDFMSYDMLVKQCMATHHIEDADIEKTRRSVRHACYSLRHNRCADVVIMPNGVAWWMPLPPELDNRHCVVLERADEVMPRRRKIRSKVVKPVANAQA